MSSLVYEYRMVSIAWPRYLASAEHPEIWLHVSSLPDTWNGLRLGDASPDLRADAVQEIGDLARSTLLELAGYQIGAGGRRRPIVHVNRGVDRIGVTLDLIKSLGKAINENDEEDDEEEDEDDNTEKQKTIVDLRASRFNRTIVLTFEQAPYGQSRPNRLVTNRAVQWHNLAHTRYFRSEKGRRIDTTDLQYRYFHNIGHLLGLGHFVARREFDELDARLVRSMSLPFARLSPPTAPRSVMYANSSDPTHASPRPTAQDRVLWRHWFLHLDQLLEYNTRYLVAGAMARNLANAFNDYARYFTA